MKNSGIKLIGTLAIIAITAFTINRDPQTDDYEVTGSIVRIDPLLDAIISGNAKAEIIAQGFEWSEGPVWIQKHKMLLFSDVPTNTVYKWTEKKGKEVYLTPSGYTGLEKRAGEIGSNGLTLDNKGNLVLCQHGNRQMARMNSTIDKPSASFTSLTSSYKGKRFNSPNDAVMNAKGELFFTDPPYGLVKGENDPLKELRFSGVYKVKRDGKTILLVDSIARPNGIAFFPGEKKLIIANSHGSKPFWYIYDVGSDVLTNGKIFYDASTSRGKGIKGSPDGLKIDKNGNVFATGPGGVWIFNRDGKVLGKIKLAKATSNCALSADEKTLYVTNHTQVLRIKMRD